LSRVPGAQTTRTGSTADLSTVSLRGASAAEVPVYLSGIRVQDELTGVSDLSRLPLWMLDRIEVYRGTSPDFVPRFGLGGAVLLEPRLPRRTEGRAGVEMGSWGSHALWLGAGASNAASEERIEPGVRASTSLAYRGAAAQNDFSYHDDGGTAFDPNDDTVKRRYNADYTSNDVWSISRFEAPSASGPVRGDVVLNAFEREQGVTSLSAVPAQRARLAITRLLGGVATRLPCLANDDCVIQLATRGNTQQQTTRDPWQELGLGTDQLSLGSTRYETRASLRARANDVFRYGADLAAETGQIGLDQPGAVRTRGTEQLVSAGALLAAEWGKGESLALARGSCLGVRGTETGIQRNVDQCFVEGRLGTAYRLSPGVELRANALRAVRPPTLGERYGVSASTRGNPDLAPEQGWAFDAGFTARTRPTRAIVLDLQAFGFARFAEQLIAYQRSALGYVRPYNVSDSRTLGVEVALASQWFDHVALRGQLTALDPRDTSVGRAVTNDLIPLLSRLTVSGELEGYVEKVGELDRAWLSLLLRYRGGRVADPAGLIVIDEQFVTDLTAGVLGFERRIALRARLENVFDVAQFDTVGYPLPGRSFFASLEFSY
jgi:iron complex outermembrane receptor protein